MIFYIKENDTLPPLKATLYGADGNVIDLTNADVVTFAMWDGAVKLNREVTVVDAVAGKVKLDWLTGDTDTPGTYKGQFKIVWLDLSEQRVPNRGYDKVVIGEDKPS